MEQHELFKSIYSSNLKSRAINVMSCLITYMNKKDNTCFPSIKTIAKCCSMGVSTVKRALEDLVEAGFVTKEARFIENKNMAQTSNLYHLSMALTTPEPKKNKAATPTCIEECTAVRFEMFKSEGEIDIEVKFSPQTHDTPGTGLPTAEIKVYMHKRQMNTTVERASVHRWTAPKPILVPP